MSVSVRITEIPKKIVASGEAMEMLEMLIAKSGGQGVWSARPMNQIKWRDNERFRVIRFDNNRIWVKMRPAGADSAWEWQIVPPSIVGAGTAYTKLLEVDGWDGHTTEAERNVRLQSRREAEAAKANGKSHPAATEKTNIIERLASLQESADRWASRAENIIAQDIALNERMEALALAEKSIQELREVHAHDEDGRRAYDAIQRLQQMLA